MQDSHDFTKSFFNHTKIFFCCYCFINLFKALKQESSVDIFSSFYYLFVLTHFNVSKSVVTQTFHTLLLRVTNIFTPHIKVIVIFSHKISHQFLCCFLNGLKRIYGFWNLRWQLACRIEILNYLWDFTKQVITLLVIVLLLLSWLSYIFN